MNCRSITTRTSLVFRTCGLITAGEYVKGRVRTNTIEGFWSQVKRSIDGTHHSVSRRYLQSYVNEFAWRYNHRWDGVDLFDSLVAKTGLTPATKAGETSI